MWGQCRRHSPHLNPTTAKSYLVEGVWPLIRDDDWCGEWKALARPAVAPSRFAPRTVETTPPVALADSTAMCHTERTRISQTSLPIWSLQRPRRQIEALLILG